MKVGDKCEITQSSFWCSWHEEAMEGKRNLYFCVVPGSKRLNVLEWSQIAGDSVDNSTCWFNVASKQCHCHK